MIDAVSREGDGETGVQTLAAVIVRQRLRQTWAVDI